MIIELLLNYDISDKKEKKVNNYPLLIIEFCYNSLSGIMINFQRSYIYIYKTNSRRKS